MGVDGPDHKAEVRLAGPRSQRLHRTGSGFEWCLWGLLERARRSALGGIRTPNLLIRSQDARRVGVEVVNAHAP